jgi:type IV secretion system protein TrbL
MVPGIASSMMNGTPSMSLGNLGAASAMMAATPVAAGLAAGAVGMQVAGLTGRAFGNTKAGAAGGIGGSPASEQVVGTTGLSRLTQATQSPSSSGVESKPGGNGFTGMPVTLGGRNATGGRSANQGDASAAQRAFDADQKQGESGGLADTLLAKSDDLQHAADRKKPGLTHDGSGGGGISIRIQHHEQ